MTDMIGFETSPDALLKTISTGQARISATAATSHFHDITAHSVGLFTDVRSGGFKCDLNLAFESEAVPEGLDSLRTSAIAVGCMLRPRGWRIF